MNSLAPEISYIPTALAFAYNRRMALVAISCVIIYDVCITLDHEIMYIWKSPWSIVKALYLFTRYVQFFEIALTTSIETLFNLSEDTCVRLSKAVPWIYVAGLSAGQVTWAVIVLLQFGLSGYDAFTYKFEIQSIVNEMHQMGCVFTGAKTSLLFANISVLLLYDGVVTLFMVAPTYHSLLTLVNLVILPTLNGCHSEWSENIIVLGCCYMLEQQHIKKQYSY
ncbi:hypothetical protein BDQ17DRAFT_1415110 [Cyathus striatus]|nr:hypothetical protein BDQ17DRAFT_1415110 [Cyathus striatus]